MKKADKILNKIPITLNLVTVIISMLILTDVIVLPYNPDYNDYDKFNYAVYEIVNTIFTITLGLICYRLKFCAYNWVAVFSLFTMNIINLIAIFEVLNTTVYYFMFMNMLIITLTILSIILYIVELRKPKTNDT